MNARNHRFTEPREDEIEAAMARIIADFGRPDSRPHPLVELHQMMIDSGRALIVHDGVTVCEPLVEVEHLGSGRIVL